MLDPLTAIGLASAIVQFVDFSSKLVSETKELYHSAEGNSIQNEELQAVTEDLKRLCKNLSSSQGRAPSAKPSTDELALLELSGSCKVVADELIAVLEKLRVKAADDKWGSFMMALRGAMKKEKIESIRARLDRIQSQLQIRLTDILREQQSALSISVRELVDRSHHLEARMTENLESLQFQLQEAADKSQESSEQTAALIQDLSTKIIELKLIVEGSKVETSVKILESLRYESMNARESEVKDEHAETFRWILEYDMSNGPDSPRFMEWLVSGCGIYWVAGKAGSGKSTLMKFLWHHSTTRAALRYWARNHKLVIASHFFWNAGNNKMQMSQVGLLRSLLFQILRQCPDLIPRMCEIPPDVDGMTPDYQWTLKGLLAVFGRLSDRSLNPVMMCFFIDGLDEYDGIHSDVVQLFQKFSKSENIKICLSSRPWNVFQNAFGEGRNPKLMLQDHTREDIQIYVKDKLAEDYRFQALANADQRYHQLIDDIVTKAQGVFLWVVLVTQSLLNGLIDDNSIPDMQRRLNLLPSDLAYFFQHMIGGIEEVYKPQTAQIFQMVTIARTPLPVFLLQYLEQESLEPNYAVKAQRAYLSEAEMTQVRKRLAKYLNARCKGLLEIHFEENKTFSFSYKIEFLHRTVRDYLASPDMKAMLKSLAPRGFNPATSLCRGYLALLKQLQPHEIRLHAAKPIHLDNVSQDIMYFARLVEIELDRSEWAVIDELDRFHATFFRGASPLRIRKHRELEDWEEIVQDSLGADFLKWAVIAGLVIYVKRRLSEDPTLMLDDIDQPLLFYALCLQWCRVAQGIEPEMVRLLLSFGADPHQRHSFSSTVWAQFLLGLPKSFEPLSEIEVYQVFKVTVILLEAGAAPELICSISYFGDAMAPLVSLKEPWSSLSGTQRRALEKAVTSHRR
ncbi:hypothetical protein NA56DRAFT_632624 [Hyaloscypha hepaticicola]|uniref:Uncharacterized protein n=1 Tax=Hyaloscypha hepaticicola TaxID=2082293 RepID=A0A2J6PRX5_9HELO|nr:hypothetical protein NA56DRAFT_632624 [Hyaloscypha hepaticicola]